MFAKSVYRKATAGNKTLMSNRVQYDSTNVEKYYYPVQMAVKKGALKIMKGRGPTY